MHELQARATCSQTGSAGHGCGPTTHSSQPAPPRHTVDRQKISGPSTGFDGSSCHLTDPHPPAIDFVRKQALASKVADAGFSTESSTHPRPART